MKVSYRRAQYDGPGYKTSLKQVVGTKSLVNATATAEQLHLRYGICRKPFGGIIF
jgi:hypothetical protein